MTLIKYTDVARNTRGDSLPDYRVQVVTSAGAGVDIYSDGAGTRFRDGSGNVVNYATANPSGKVEFYWTPATGQILQVLDTSGTLVDTDADFADKYVVANLAGEVPQDQVTDLPADLAAKADAEATTAALATKAAAADLASTDAAKGAALVGQSRTGGTARTVDAVLNDLLPHAFDKIPEDEHAAILAGTSTYDATADLQWLIDNYNGFRLPTGVVRVDPVVGLVVGHGTRIAGFGMTRSVIYALEGGGSVAQLAAYERGSVIRRAFDPEGTNSYVQGVELSDFAVVLNHPTDAVTTTAIQIGFDFRNITRSFITRVFCGNYAPEGGPLIKPRAGSFEYQGYGAVFGNVPGGSTAYAGGEVNTIRDSHVWQTYRAVNIDDPALCGPSAAYATTVDNCDIQGCHDGIIEHSQSSAINKYLGNVIQNIQRQPGNTDDTHCYNIQGYNSLILAGYIEAGSVVDYIIRLGPQSDGNFVRLVGYSATNVTAIDVLDDGEFNIIHHSEQTGGEVSGRGRKVVTTNGARDKVKAKFAWVTDAIVTDEQIGVASITRNAVGDYTLTFEQAMPDANYDIQITLDTGASGIPGIVTIAGGSVSAASCRFYTYQQNGATTTQIDPRKVWVRIEQ